MPSAFSDRFLCVFVVTQSGEFDGETRYEDIHDEAEEFKDILIPKVNENDKNYAKTLAHITKFKWFTANVRYML